MLGIILISICMAVAVVADLYYMIKDYEEEE